MNVSDKGVWKGGASKARPNATYPITIFEVTVICYQWVVLTAAYMFGSIGPRLSCTPTLDASFAASLVASVISNATTRCGQNTRCATTTRHQAQHHLRPEPFHWAWLFMLAHVLSQPKLHSHVHSQGNLVCRSREV